MSIQTFEQKALEAIRAAYPESKGWDRVVEYNKWYGGLPDGEERLRFDLTNDVMDEQIMAFVSSVDPSVVDFQVSM